MRLVASCTFVLATLAAAPLGAASAEFPQAHADPQIQPDPTIHFGSLANGLRYAIQVNHQPPGKCSLRLQVEHGSIDEDDQQRGLAHFLEHMAFNGSTHFPPGKLIEYLQSIGLAFGADTNAHTSFDETVYKLDMPDVKPETIATGLTVLADDADALTIGQEQVDHERGVILAEMRDRNTPDYRAWVAEATHAFAGTRVAIRQPIGTKADVEAATAALLRSYWNDWYRPQDMVLAVVGDVDPVAIEHQIQSAFAAATARSTRQATPVGRPEVGRDIWVWHEAEDSGTVARVEVLRPRERPHDTVAERRAGLLRDLGTRVFNRRIADLAERDPQGPILSGALDMGQWLTLWDATAEVNCRPGKAVAALHQLEVERRRLLAFGPTPEELTVVIGAMRADLDQAVAQAGTRTNARLASELYNDIFYDRVSLAPSQVRDLLAPMLDHVSPGDVTQAMNDAWADAQARWSVCVSGRDDLGPQGEQAVREAFTQANTETVTPPQSHALAQWAYGQITGPAGSIVSDRTVDPAVRELAFANGALANVRRNDAQPNQVQLALRLVIPTTPRAPGLSDFVSQVFVAGALGKHSEQDLREIFAPTSVAIVGLGFQEDGAVLVATCLPKDLELCLQEMRAYVIDPGWREEAAVRAKTAWLEELQAVATDLDAQVQRAYTFTATDNAPQRRPVTYDEAKGITLAEARAWFEPYLATAPLELSISGDIDVNAAGELARRYIGSLPERRKHTIVSDPHAPGVLTPCPPLPAKLLSLEVPGENPRALIVIGWPTDDIYDIRKTRRLQMLASAMTEKLRVKVRNELGQAYSPYAYEHPSEAYRGFGQILAVVGVAPERAQDARAAVLAVADDLVAHGVDASLMTRIKEPLMKNLATIRQRNEYWLNQVELRCQEQPFRLQWSTMMVEDIGSITAADLDALAKTYLDNAKALQVVGICHGTPAPKTATPAPAPAPTPAPAPPAGR